MKKGNKNIGKIELLNRIEGIKRTGYALEFEISNILRSKGWNIINNRYYVDEKKEREIDILAYKVIIIDEGVYFYSTLIISCKKNEECEFCFFTKDKIVGDPNIDYYPMKYWSNIPIFLDQIEKRDKIKYLSILEKEDFFKKTYSTDKQIFAFQMLDKKNCKPQNDKPIYDSIISLIKAYESEKKSLKKRKKEKVYYDFSLITVIEGDIIEAYFNNKNEIKIIENREELKYVNRHIIDESENFYKIHFIKKEKFENILEDYENQTKYTAENLKTDYEEYFKKFPSKHNYSVMRISISEFITELQGTFDAISLPEEIKHVYSSYDINEKELSLDFGIKINEYLNNSGNGEWGHLREGFIDEVKKKLKKIYKYDGKVKFGKVLTNFYL